MDINLFFHKQWGLERDYQDSKRKQNEFDFFSSLEKKPFLKNPNNTSVLEEIWLTPPVQIHQLLLKKKEETLLQN